MSTSFAISCNYRHPFARNGFDHVVEGPEGGAGWNGTFIPFSLSRAHVALGGRDVSGDESKGGDLLAVEAGLALLDGPELNEFQHTTIPR